MIENQRANVRMVAESLAPIFMSKMKVNLLLGNKPQVGFVLLRSDVANHVLLGVTLDVCGADTQVATGYILRLAILNCIRKIGIVRNKVCVVTYTLVDASALADQTSSAIGPWCDCTRAFQYREARQWEIIEEPGHGYRRVVPSLKPIEILEMDCIQQISVSGDIVIAAAGGGVPVTENDSGELVGVEVVVAIEVAACLLAQEMKARILFIIVEKSKKYILTGLNFNQMIRITVEQLDNILEKEVYPSRIVRSELQSASEFLHSCGEQEFITTVDKLTETLEKKAGLWIGSHESIIS